MAFKPHNSGKGNNSNNGEFIDYSKMPVPKSGSRKARLSLIVDLGIQQREDFEDKDTGETRPQKPCHQVAAFADLTADTVDYGGDIGKQHYRLLLNKSFAGKIQGINFTTTPPKDAKGNLIQGKPWGLHPANLLTKLAKAVGKEEIIYDDRNNDASLDISLLLNEPFMAMVEVKETESDKEDKDGNKIVYKNVNYKGCSPVPTDEDDDGNEVQINVPELKVEPKCITFDNATKDDIKFIRAGLIKMIKLAENYSGSQMEKAIKEFEAEKGEDGGGEDNGEDAGEKAEKPTKPATKPKAETKPKKPATPKKPEPVEENDDGDDIPF